MTAKKRKSGLGNREIGEDRLSQLPDELIHKIFSFMEMVGVVRTCLLSKRWRYLWTSHPFLNFDFHSCARSEIDDLYFKACSYIKFVNQVLLRRDGSPIVKFWFDSPYGVETSAIEAFIYYAVKHQVQHLHITANCPDGAIEFPLCFYTCSSLTKLELRGSRNLPKSLGLPSLKFLHLGLFRGFDGNIFSSCPNLEILKLEDIILGDIENFSIHALNLKRLEFLYPIIFESDSKVMIFAPKLTKFKFIGCSPLVFSNSNLPSLNEVDIDFCTMLDCYPAWCQSKQESGPFLFNMLNEFHNAKSITLSFQTIEILSMVPDKLKERPSQFSNLKCLKLKTDNERCARI